MHTELLKLSGLSTIGTTLRGTRVPLGEGILNSASLLNNGIEYKHAKKAITLYLIHSRKPYPLGYGSSKKYK